MTQTRWVALMEDDLLPLTEDEIKQQYHFCPDWDGLLISPEHGEWETCTCKIPNKLPLDPQVKALMEASRQNFIAHGGAF